MSDLPRSEYDALRATIRERGSMRLGTVLAGLVAWAALAIALLAAQLQGAVTLVPFVVLLATFEINFFVHTGVERVGRFIQVFYEEATGSAGWETSAMSYGTKFPGGLDPLFGRIFLGAAALNFLSALAIPDPRLGWVAISLAAHSAFAYRIFAARRLAAGQRAVDLDRFRSLLSK